MLDGLAGPVGDHPLERTHRASARERDPILRRLCGGDAGEQTDLRPRELAALERRGDGRQTREALRDPRERLQLARREAQALAREVAETREPERVLPAPAEEVPRKGAEHPAPAGFLAGETSQVAVEQSRRCAATKAPALLGRRRDERRRGDDVRGRGVGGGAGSHSNEVGVE